MRSALQLLLFTNLALLALRDLILAWLIQRRTKFTVSPHGKAAFLPFVAYDAVREAEIQQPLRAIWHFTTVARNACALLFVFVFIAVFAQARWPYFWFIVKSQIF